MLKPGALHSMVVLLAVACFSPADFSPPPETYTESRAMIEGAVDQRTIASIDSTFFGRNLPMLGRAFSGQEYTEESPVTILSHSFWMEQLDGRPDVIGSELEVGGVVRRIVGIMPQGVDVPAGVALWTPRN